MRGQHINSDIYLELKRQFHTVEGCRPSVVRYTLLFIIIIILFWIIAACCLLALLTTFANDIWNPIYEYASKIENPDESNMVKVFFFGIRAALILGFVLSLLIVWLAKRNLQRNRYIIDLLTFTDVVLLQIEAEVKREEK